MTPIKRSRVHKGDCHHCNKGTGQKNQHKNDSGNTGWFPDPEKDKDMPAFDTYEDAKYYMENTYPDFDNGPCRHCKPDQ